MKKVLFLALAAAAVMSCSENEVIENAGQKAEIKVGTVVSNTTRAAVTNLAELQKPGVGFTVYAYNTGETAMVSVKDANEMTAFMSGVTATYSASAWSLSGGPYYWPAKDNLQFFAYGNGNPSGNALIYNAPAAAVTYPTITYEVADVDAQTDFVVAQTPDMNKSKNIGGISLEFTHALTQINFTIKAADALTYKLTALNISGVCNKGTYDFSNSEWKSQEGTATYTCTVADGGEAVAESGVVKDVAWMLMPQTLEADAKINVSYDIYKGDVLLDNVVSALDLKDTQAWGKGKKIRYTLTLANEAAQVTMIDPEVGGWSAGDDTNVDVPKDK